MLAEDARRTRVVDRVSVGSCLVALAVFSTGFLQPTLVENAILGDIVIVGLVLTSAVNVAGGNGAIGDIARRLAVPAALIALGSLIAAMTVGLQEWTVGDFLRDAVVAAAFLATLDVVRREGAQSLRWASWALAAAGAIVSVQLVLDTGIRAQATFPNPNVAGHFLATTFLALLVLPLPPWVRRSVLVVVSIGLVRTSSFGALLQVAVGLGFLGLVWLRRSPLAHHHRVGVVAVLVASFGLAAAVVVPGLVPEENTETTGISSERLDRSASGRLTTWEEGLELVTHHPLGVGAGSTGGLELLSQEKELHNEPLAYLVERGVLGLAGIVTLAVALWRLAPAGGGARALLLGFGLSSLVRETSHYRHLWLVLALVLVADEVRRHRGETRHGRW